MEDGSVQQMEESRVQVTSKKQVIDLIDQYKEILKKGLDKQPEVQDDIRRRLVEDLLANFEAAVQVNVLVNGFPWDESSDAESDDEAVDLETRLDDTIVETTRRRRTFPKRILPHMVHALKAQRKVIELYEQTVKPEEVTRDPRQESIMSELTAVAPPMVREAIQVIKSINTLQEQARGICQVLNMEPSLASLEIHREVFDKFECGPRPAAKQPIRRALKRVAVSGGYEPHSKKPEQADGREEHE
ncbi:unnamed protein product [Ophioblennius macclurei]